MRSPEDLQQRLGQVAAAIDRDVGEVTRHARMHEGDPEALARCLERLRRMAITMRNLATTWALCQVNAVLHLHPFGSCSCGDAGTCDWCMNSNKPSEDDAPVVCGGCFAVGAEPHAPDCIDERIRQDQEERIERGELNDPTDDLGDDEG